MLLLCLFIFQQLFTGNLSPETQHNFAPVSARYVRVRVTQGTFYNNNAARLAELEVYGGISGLVNALPVANAGGYQGIIQPAQAIRLQGSGSDADCPDKSCLSYQWTNIVKPVPAPAVVFDSVNAAATWVRNLTIAGRYIFRLSVSDELCLYDSRCESQA
jgi:hypothetical protein